MLVGGFFVISGYVAVSGLASVPSCVDGCRESLLEFFAQVSAYTSTKLGERKAEDKKLANPELFFWQRVGLRKKGCLVWSGVRFSARQVMAYYPLHFVVSAIFAPMFIQVERWRQRCACMCGEVMEGYDTGCDTRDTRCDSLCVAEGGTTPRGPPAHSVLS